MTATYSSRPLALTCALSLLACEAPAPPAALTLYVVAEDEAVIAALAAELPVQPARVVVAEDPAAALGTAESGEEIAVVSDLACRECYRVEAASAGAVVHGDAPLGVQYGVGALLEAAGVRFFHPAHARVPDALALGAAAETIAGVEHTPRMTMRGLHLHTLHPIEAYYALLEPSPQHLAEARRIIDWIVHIRGNVLQFYLLDDLKESPPGVREHLLEIIEYAHLRGLRVGVSVQLFGEANLQRGYNLSTGVPDLEGEIRANLAVLDGLGLDMLKISFGEFRASEPDRFIAALDYVTEQAHLLWPDIEVTASVHVGDEEELRVDYGGETDLLYYFLVKFADARITPWIHTVMYYDLFHSASGAYNHTDFSEHREYLYERLAADEPVAYYPESAYWVAFDNSVPTYLPVYLRARFTDLERIDADAAAMGISPLRQHALFSSGWEWGYWQTDYLVTRNTYEAATLEDAMAALFAPLGADGDAAVAAVLAVADAQHEALVVGELGPYLAGRDVTIDAGFLMGVVAAPDRVSFEELSAMTAPEQDAFEADVLTPMAALADATEAARATLPADRSDPWLQEIDDGLAVDVLRGRFVVAVYGAALAAARGEDPATALAAAATAQEEALTVVERRHAAMWDPEPVRLTARRRPTSTLYQYGYLREANTLCFWTRELAQARNLLLGTDERVPGCVL